MTDLISSDHFEQSPVRRVWHQEEWWFSVIDVIEQLTGSDRPRKYWNDLKKKLFEEGYNELSEKIGQLKMEASDGKMRKTDAANAETLFRLIQSVPSPKAEPVKRLIARLAAERAEELADPEKGIKTLAKPGKQPVVLKNGLLHGLHPSARERNLLMSGTSVVSKKVMNTPF